MVEAEAPVLPRPLYWGASVEGQVQHLRPLERVVHATRDRRMRRRHVWHVCGELRCGDLWFFGCQIGGGGLPKGKSAVKSKSLVVRRPSVWSSADLA